MTSAPSSSAKSHNDGAPERLSSLQRQPLGNMPASDDVRQDERQRTRRHRDDERAERKRQQRQQAGEQTQPRERKPTHTNVLIAGYLIAA